MATLTVYTNRAVRSAVAKKFLSDLGISYDIVDLETTPSAVEFLESKGRDLAHYPAPQFYVGDVLAWEHGFKDISNLTATEINQRIEEINASI